MNILAQLFDKIDLIRPSIQNIFDGTNDSVFFFFFLKLLEMSIIQPQADDKTGCCLNRQGMCSKPYFHV